MTLEEVHERTAQLMGKRVRATRTGMASTNRYDPDTREPILAAFSVVIEGEATGWEFSGDLRISVAGCGWVDDADVEVIHE